MECCNSIKRTPIIEASLLIGVKPQRGGAHISVAKVGLSSPSRESTLHSQILLKVSGTPKSTHHIYARRRRQPLVLAVAKTQSTGCEKYTSVATPLEPISPEGKFLSGILKNQRHFFQFAVSEQLDELASDRVGAAARMNQSSGSMESLLHKRIADIKEKECQVAIEDIMYMSIVHKFSKVEVPMVPKLTECISNNTLDMPSKCRDLESIHPLEVQEMIKEHLATVLQMRGKSSADEGLTTTKINRLHLGRIYASSIMYGYFLKSACFRRKLDFNLARTQKDLQPFGHESMFKTPIDAKGSQSLKSYVMGFDSESLQSCAKLKYKEAVNLIEKHTWALFGDEEVGELNCNNYLTVTFPSLERLVLEAVAFGSFLWDVEKSVHSVYELREN